MKKPLLVVLVSLWSVLTLKVRAGYNPRCSCHRKVRNEDATRGLKRKVSTNSNDSPPTETSNFGNEPHKELKWVPDTFDWRNVSNRNFLVPSW